MAEYLIADLIGKALVDKTNTKPNLVVTDVPAALPLRSRIEMPVIALRSQTSIPDSIPFDHERSASGLLLPARFPLDQPTVMELLDRVDGSVDLGEPFARIREAIAEARKMGVTNRAA
jgi:hypothetical protein